MIPGYRLIEMLGVGATATVYLAEGPGGRKVALKIPKAEALRDPVLGRMISQEVSLYRVLSHPSILPAYGGTAGGEHPFLALMYCPSGPVSAGRREPAVILQVLSDVAAALQYLHGKHIIHQDVKPSNIFEEGGRGYLADFGAAASEAQPWRTAGSPFYMAPELFNGERNSPRSDLYALGVVAYELLTGVRPIHGTTYDEVRAAHLSAVPSHVRAHGRDLPKAAASVIDRALSKDPAARPAVAEFQDAMQRAIRELHGRATIEEAPPAPIAAVVAAPARRIEASAMRVKDEPGFLDRLLRRRK